MTKTQWSRRAALKKMLAGARSSSRRSLQHPQLQPRQLTPHRPRPRHNRPHPLPPLPHRALPTSRGRWRAAASRRGAGGRRYAHIKKKEDGSVQSVLLNILSFPRFRPTPLTSTSRVTWWPSLRRICSEKDLQTLRSTPAYRHSRTVAAHTPKHMTLWLTSRLSVVETAGLCQVNEEM